MLVEEMEAFTTGSFMDDESLHTIDYSSPHWQYKMYDCACSDLYGEIDQVLAKCLLDGKVPDEDSAMHEVLVEILDSAFACAVTIARPRMQFLKDLKIQCKRLVEIADAKSKLANQASKADRKKEEVVDG